jgi:glycosyltransferase involved in cell wall biosynthesis
VVGRHEGGAAAEQHGYGIVYEPRRHLLRKWPVLGDRVEAMLEARKALRALGPFDVVEGPDWLAEGLLAPRGSLRARHVHGSYRSLRLHGGRPAGRSERLAERLESYDMRRADVVTAASQLSTRLPSGQPALDVPVHIVPMPVELDSWQSSKAGDAPGIVTLFGRIEPRKGADVLIRAAASLRDLSPTLRFVGRSLEPGYLAALNDLARTLGVAVEFLGGRPLQDMPALYAGSRVVAVPSRFEPFSMVALEALAARRPVVLSDACGAAEALDGLALVFPSGDEEALADHLRRTLSDPSYATDLGERGRSHVAARNSPRASAEAKVAVWRSALEHRVKGGADRR